MHETHRDKTVGICVRKWAKQDSIHHAEDRCGCANSEHEGDDDGESKDRIATEAAKAVADVLHEGFQEITGALFVRFLRCPLDSSEGNNCLPMSLLRDHSRGRVRLDLFIDFKMGLRGN